MDGRLMRVAAFAAAVLSLGASYRTQNFVVKASHNQLAKEIGESAELHRRQLAVQWLGQELPPWRQKCPIEVNEGPHLGAGGATSFMFEAHRPMGWRMTVQGSRQRILDSVLPHEVTHTIFATHFGQPLPRWADEGACTTVEHASERYKQEQLLRRFLTTERGIPFNKMFAMKEYPHDILPLYSQGYSVVRFLLAQGDRRKFVDFVGYGLQVRNWNEATRKFYGYRDLSDLQLQWVDWVQAGSPSLATSAPSQLAQDDAPRERDAVHMASGSVAPRRGLSPAGLVPVPEAPWSGRSRAAAAPSQRTNDSWYARQRRRAEAEQATRFGPPGISGVASADLRSTAVQPPRSLARPQAAQQPRAHVLQWDDQTLPPATFTPRTLPAPPVMIYEAVPFSGGGVGRQ